jgi:hypothetical protein
MFGKADGKHPRNSSLLKVPHIEDDKSFLPTYEIIL